MSRFLRSVLLSAAIAGMVCSSVWAEDATRDDAEVTPRMQQRLARLRAQETQRPQAGGEFSSAAPARGDRALSASTLGGRPSPQVVGMAGDVSLSLDGDLDLAGYVFQGGVPFIHNEGGALFKNTAVGLYALTSLTLGAPYIYSGAANTAVGLDVLRATTSGFGNTGVGDRVLKDNQEGNYNTVSGAYAMYQNTSGSSNTASGFGAMLYNTTGSRNVAIGEEALYKNLAGSENTALGYRALRANTGTYNAAVGSEALRVGTNSVANTAVGFRALYGNTGDANTAIGIGAGINWTDGDYNIALGTGAYGVAGESGTIRIGGQNYQSTTYIEGIRGASYPPTYYFDEQVCTNSFNQLGPCGGPSSQRFKDGIEEMSAVSEALDSLQPVTFHYKKRTFEADGPPHYGLIAEEVAKVFPHVVRYDDEGKPQSIRYELLTPMLLKELQDEKQRRDAEVDDLQQQVAELRKLVADITRRQQIQKE